MDNSDNNIDISRITDNMKPPKFRIQKWQDFSAHTLPLTKNNEQYLMIEQVDKQQSDTMHYYVVDNGTTVIGRFDISWYELNYGITYHIVDEFQNRGIGQTALKFVVDELFNKYSAVRIRILAVNDRSRNIALKSGFRQKTEKLYELSFTEFQREKSKDDGLEDR